MVASQVTTISQLTNMVSAVQLKNKTIMSCFDTLSTQITALLANPDFASSKQWPAGGPATSGSTS